MNSKLIRNIKKKILFLIIIMFNCSFVDPASLIFKNVGLIPDVIDKENRYPDLKPTSLNKEKTENISKQIKMPSINAKKPADDVLPIKDKIKMFNGNINNLSKLLTPDAKSIDTMFNLTNIGLGKLVNGNKDDKGITIEFLENSAKKNPVSINLAPMPNMPKKLPFPGGISKNVPSISNPVTDIQIPGIEDPMPSKLTNPLTKKDYDFDPNLQILTDFITPDDTMNSNVLDILP